MSASVRIEDEAFSDERYADLAEHLGLPDADCARGKMARIWRQCTIETRYALDVRTIERILGPNGVDALVKSRLGESKRDGSVRICGTEGRVEWLDRLRKNGKHGVKGGRPKKTHQGFANETLGGVENKTPPAPAPAPAPTKKREESAPRAALRAVPDPDLEQAFATYVAYFKRRTGHPPTCIPKQRKKFDDLARALGPSEIERRIGILATTNPWPHEPWNVDTLVKHIDKIAAPPTTNSTAPARRIGPSYGGDEMYDRKEGA